MEIFSALEELEIAANITPPQGAFGLPPKIRYREILSRLKKEICHNILQKNLLLESEKASLLAAIADIILLKIADLDVPATTIARSILIVGIEEFCNDPSSIFNKKK